MYWVYTQSCIIPRKPDSKSARLRIAIPCAYREATTDCLPEVAASRFEADNVVSTMPIVTTRTEMVCLGGYLGDRSYFRLHLQGAGRTDRFFTSRHPNTMLTIIPPLRKMMWTVMGISYANAVLLRVDSAKKSAT